MIPNQSQTIVQAARWIVPPPGALDGSRPPFPLFNFAAFMQNGPDVARTLSFSAALKTGDRPRQHNSMPQFRDRQTRERIAMMEDH